MTQGQLGQGDADELPDLGRDPCTERLLGIDPLVVRRRVLWGECDPAGVVYTPRFAEYFVAASDWFKIAALGIVDRPGTGHSGPAGSDLAFPLRALSFDFQSFLAADDVFDMMVRVSAMSRHTFTLVVAATHLGGRAAFTASGTHICIDRASQATAVLADDVRERLERHRAQL